MGAHGAKSKTQDDDESFGRKKRFDSEELLGSFWSELPGGWDGKGKSYALPLPIDSTVRETFKQIAIEERYEQQKKKKRQFNPRAIQIGEIQRLIRHRYGAGLLPDDEIGRKFVFVLAHALMTLPSGDQKVARLLEERASWYSEDETYELGKSLRKPRRFKAATLGQWFQVTAKERSELGLTQMRAIDAPDPTKPETKRARARQRKEKSRRAKGVIPREKYLRQALSRTRPWEQLGISRAQWYRRAKANPEMRQVCHKHIYPTACDGLATRALRSPLRGSLGKDEPALTPLAQKAGQKALSLDELNALRARFPLNPPPLGRLSRAALGFGAEPGVTMRPAGKPVELPPWTPPPREKRRRRRIAVLTDEARALWAFLRGQERVGEAEAEAWFVGQGLGDAAAFRRARDLLMKGGWARVVG